MRDTIRDGMKVTLLHFGLAAVLAVPAPAYAMQDADESALEALDGNSAKPPVIKQEPAGAAELRDAVRRIAQRPTDSFALADAGYAAVKLGDYDAAYNFFTKASALQPSDARIKAGLGIAQVRRENPFEALSLFDEAARLGASDRSFAMDRALAFDLLGNFERAERDYVLAASLGGNDELTLRHAISLSLAGRKDEADRMLIPLLQSENPEAWRARALMLAARGDTKEAGKIASGFLPEREARRMDGYFRNMTRLTAAQQAAAMHFGHFPVGSNIGEDSATVKNLATATGAKPQPSGGDSRLIPTGEPLGTKTAAAKVERPGAVKVKAKPPKKGEGNLSTTSAQQAVDAAARAKVTTISGQQLPIPETARPPVRIALPALSQPKIAAAQPKTSATELPATGPAVNAKGGIVETDRKITSVAMGTDQKAVQTETRAETKIENLDNFTLSQQLAKAEPVELPAAKQAILAENKPDVKPDIQPENKSEIADVAVIEKPVDKGPIGPGFESVEVKTQAAIDTPVTIAEANVQPETLAKAEIVELPAAKAEASFDLGALVESIEVPDDEKRPSVAPVDLKKIKTAAAKTEAVPVKADPAAKATKIAASVPRIYVQVATGADANGLGFDYRRLAKKFAALFAGQSGWTSPWGKTRRLLIGPFPDMKVAKKWEADFRKAGGDGFVWQSDKNTEVEKLKSK
jgi:Flp pilus assembly protein TadD